MAVAPIAAAASMPEPHNVPTAADAHSVVRGVEPGHGHTLLEDYARAEEADAGRHLRGHARGVSGAGRERIDANSGEQAGTQRHQRVRADARAACAQLPFQSDERAEPDAEQDAQGYGEHL